MAWYMTELREDFCSKRLFSLYSTGFITYWCVVPQALNTLGKGLTREISKYAVD